MVNPFYFVLFESLDEISASLGRSHRPCGGALELEIGASDLVQLTKCIESRWSYLEKVSKQSMDGIRYGRTNISLFDSTLLYAP